MQNVILQPIEVGGQQSLYLWIVMTAYAWIRSNCESFVKKSAM